MKKIIVLTLLLSYIPHLKADTGNQETTLQEVEAVLKELESKKTTSVSQEQTTQPVKASSRKRRRKPTPSIVVATPPPIKKRTVITPPVKAVELPTPPLVPSVMNPNVYFINTTKHNFTAFTASSAESGLGGFSQTSMPLMANSSGQLPLTNRAQKFVGAQVVSDDPIGDGGMQTNMTPIALRTPWAVIDNKGNVGEDNFQLQYLPALEQSAAVIINPSTQSYVLKIMNQFTEQIDIENTGNQNPAYLVLTIALPALSTIPLPILMNNSARLHLECPANNQCTKIDYPIINGFYVVQEKQQGEIPRISFNSNDFSSGTEKYLYLQQVNG